MARALNTKLRRELKHLWGPALAASLVIAAGIVAFLSMRGAYESLEAARTGYFERARFAHVIVRAADAPESLIPRALAIPGVQAVEPRLSADISLQLEGLDETAHALLVSTQAGGLNAITVRDGDPPRRPLEVMVSDAFAAAHHMRVGDALDATVEGRRVVLTVVGVGGSPDYLYVVPPGSAWPDDRRYGVLWMEHDSAAALLGSRGSFDELLVRLEPAGDRYDVLENEVRAALDALFSPFTAFPSRGRDQQIGWRFVSEELRQLDTQTFAVPLIFLGIAALLLNMVLVRLVETQREIIALLKAVGYSSGSVAWHYVKLALAIVAPGVVLGLLGGEAAGRGLMITYRMFFHFDRLEFALSAQLVVVALTATFASTLIGALGAARRAAALEPAAAMQPPAPPAYARGFAERLGLLRALTPGARMVTRQLMRRPIRTALTVVAVAFSVAIVVVSSVMNDAIRYALDLYFKQAAREDIEVSLFLPRPRAALESELLAVPGVIAVESTRMVPVRAHGPRGSWEGAIEARARTSSLRVALDQDARALPPLPADGVVLTDEIARRIGVRAGDEVALERLDGDRRTVRAQVAGMSQDMLGLHCTAALDAAARLLGDGDVVTGALLQVDAREQRAVLTALKDRANVAGVVTRMGALEAFERLMADAFAITRIVLALLASLLAVGIVYNNGRIGLAERARELATLRVLGLTRAEVSWLFIGEQILLIALALPCGWALGRGITELLLSSTSMTDVFRLPIVTRVTTYGFATVIVLGAGLFTALLMRRRIDRLDLVAVLKARE